ncbi:hypothetical protein [Actinomadura decatromicini]|uniref:Uncharacterized protein n=1 Tax=Actinomadura decatromicini TaxID=2604572 RepID=A0A5D3FYV9_9ACTN|nr:hypothetical protein [Actinomadura decatromicini]TYK53222.1 hypothetical protein FXF68_05760 [Actinomadura decatromicini]
MSGVTAVVERMARREAAVFFLRSREMTPLVARVMRCPACGAGTDDAEEYLHGLPVWGGPPAVTVLPATEPRPPGGDPALTMLACEALPARAFLLIAEAAHGNVALDVRTRAAAWTTRPPGPEPAALHALDAAERWADVLPLRPSGDAVLPISTRLRPDPRQEWQAHRTRLAQHFLTPHCTAHSLRELNETYQRVRICAAADLLVREGQLGY